MSLASSVVGLVTGVAGTCASAIVLLVLILARRHFGSHVNTLITNQSAMDILACLFLAVGFAMTLPGALDHYLWLGEVGNYVICFLFRSRVLAYMCLNVEKIGLENDREEKRFVSDFRRYSLYEHQNKFVSFWYQLFFCAT